MAMETAKCPKCGKDARRTGMTLESGQLTIPPAKMSPLTGIRPRSPSASARLTKHMACGTCGHAFKVKLS